MRDKEYWDTIEGHFRQVHREGEMLESWMNNADRFVEDLMDLVKACYSEGALDAFDEMSDVAEKAAYKLYNEVEDNYLGRDL